MAKESSTTSLSTSSTRDTIAHLTYGSPFMHNKLVLVLVGLPARGKSYISHKVTSYFNWQGVRSKIFNVGKSRRKVASAEEAPESSKLAKQTSDFFSKTNKDASALREALAMGVLDELIEWSCETDEPSIAVFDATNTTRERRSHVVERCARSASALNVIFVESICDSDKVLTSNLLQKVRNRCHLSFRSSPWPSRPTQLNPTQPNPTPARATIPLSPCSPDFANMNEDEALADLQQRIKNYEDVYEPLDDDSQSYIKLINMQVRGGLLVGSGVKCGAN